MLKPETKGWKMEKRMVVTRNDYDRLMDLIDPVSVKVGSSRVVGDLMENLVRAKMLPQHAIAKNIVTMNSRVKLKDMKTNRETEITITYPQDAESVHMRVSILSEIGLALFGRSEKDIVSWKVPYGVGMFEIGKITYQPEAAGHYNL